MNKLPLALCLCLLLAGCGSRAVAGDDECSYESICVSRSYAEALEELKASWSVTEIRHRSDGADESIDLAMQALSPVAGHTFSVFISLAVSQGRIKSIGDSEATIARALAVECDKNIEWRSSCIEMPERYIGVGSYLGEGQYKFILKTISDFFRNCPVSQEDCDGFLRAVPRLDRPALVSRVVGGPHEYVYFTFGEDLTGDTAHSGTVMLKRDVDGRFQVVEFFMPARPYG